MGYGSYDTFRVTGPDDLGVLHVELNRPGKLNAMNHKFWDECRDIFLEVPHDTSTRVVVISAQGRAFSAGLDLSDMGGDDGSKKSGEKPDIGRRGYHVRRHVLRIQESFNAIESCPQPVIVVGHGAVVGGGIDLMCACCIRYASKDAWFTIKEVDIGIAADVGTLQRLPKIIGHEGKLRELAYTARRFDAVEAHRIGFLSEVFESQEAALAGAMALAKEIASKSPLGVVGTKRMLTHARDHSVQDGLDYVATWNAAALQTGDLMKAAMASVKKEKVQFSKL